MTSAKEGTTKKTAAKHQKNNPCWPGFEPVAGKKPGTKGSCERTPGTHTKATRRATQRSAAASKLSVS